MRSSGRRRTPTFGVGGVSRVVVVVVVVQSRLNVELAQNMVVEFIAIAFSALAPSG